MLAGLRFALCRNGSSSGGWRDVLFWSFEDGRGRVGGLRCSCGGGGLSRRGLGGGGEVRGEYEVWLGNGERCNAAA